MAGAMSRPTGLTALLVLLSSALARSGAAVPHSALGADDACDAQAGNCAVSALQLGSSARGALTGTSEEVKPQSSGAEAEEDDPKWVWPKELADKQQKTDRYRSKPFTMDLYYTFAPKMVQHCVEWVAYFWPMMSFWSQEVLRRVEALPADADEAAQEKLRQFSLNASYLMCDFWFDPRSGTNWSKPVQEYMMRVKSAPSDDLDMPRLEGFFDSTEARRDLWAADSCLFWSSSLMCDIGLWSRDMQGSKDHGDGLCWDQVPTPEYAFTALGASLQHDRPEKPDDVDAFLHPEYLQCMEKPVTQELLEHRCPMFGHYSVGFLNVTDWGHGYEKGSSNYDQALKCQAKLKIPETVGLSGDLVVRPWSSNISLIDPPSADQDVNFMPSPEAGQKVLETVMETLQERDDWRRQQYKAWQAKKKAAEEGK